MFKWIWNKIICKHEWTLLENKMFEETYVWLGKVVNREVVEYSFLCCPKCDKQKTVDANEWRRTQMALKVKEGYNKK